MSLRWIRLAVVIFACSAQVAVAKTRGNVYTGESNSAQNIPDKPCPLQRSAHSPSPGATKTRIMAVLGDSGAGGALSPKGNRTDGVK